MLKITPAKAATLVSTLESKHQQALHEISRYKSELGQAALSELEETPGATESLIKLRKGLERSVSEVTEIEEALKLAKMKYGAALKQELDAEIKRRWRETEGHVIARNAIATEIEKTAKRLKTQLDELKKLGIQAYESAPTRELDLNSSLLAPDHVDSDFRLLLRKLGFTWAFGWPWGEHQIPTFSSRVIEGSSWVLKLRKISDDSNPEGVSKHA